MNIVINTARLDYFFNLPAGQMFWVFMANVGWIIIAIVFLSGVRELYLFWMRVRWGSTHKNILLAIDIPRGNEQTPKAVENMFTYLGGAHGSISFFEKWFEGKFQKCFSFEIVSLEGYTQFLIQTPAEFRNLVETAVYSQYPDAEIAEVDDYVQSVPASLPDEEYDVWGTEFIQNEHFAYPIKCYQEFEHNIGASETQFKDPMASLMDLCGSLRQGEQLWMQILVIPTGFAWTKDAQKESDKLLGRKGKAKKGWGSKIVEAMGEASEIIYPIWGEIVAKEEKAKSMMELSPGEKKKIEAIHLKLAQIAFEAKFRVVYVAKKDDFNRGKVVSGIVGYMKQFASLDLNNMKPDVDMTFTKAVYFFQKSRLLAKKRKIFQAYIHRSDGRGRKPGLYSIAELATLWHFPVEANVKAALMQKASGRKANAPASLPLAEEKTAPLPELFNARRPETVASSSESVSVDSQATPTNDLSDQKAVPPANLPFV
jgi:hypothetical protein